MFVFKCRCTANNVDEQKYQEADIYNTCCSWLGCCKGEELSVLGRSCDDAGASR